MVAVPQNKTTTWGIVFSLRACELMTELMTVHTDLHDPMCVCVLQYGNGDFAPGIKYGESGKWKCGHNLLLAHAKAVKVYRDNYKAKNDGKIGMALWSEWSEPWTQSEGGECCWLIATGEQGQEARPCPSLDLAVAGPQCSWMHPIRWCALVMLSWVDRAESMVGWVFGLWQHTFL